MVSKALALGLRGFQVCASSKSIVQVISQLLTLHQFFCALIVLALTANQVAMGGTPAIINYDLFVSIFALLSLIYLIAATVNESFIMHRAAMLGVDALNVLWLFCAAVATAAILGVHSCNSEVNQTPSFKR